MAYDMHVKIIILHSFIDVKYVKIKFKTFNLKIPCLPKSRNVCFFSTNLNIKEKSMLEIEKFYLLIA